MNTHQHVVKRFADMGARLDVRPASRWMQTDYRLDIVRDRREEYFVLDVTAQTPQMQVPQVDRAQRHLVLTVGKDNFLCGHDERHWFAAALPRRALNVMDARKALLPNELADVPMNHTRLTKRHNDLYVRQGEWFFVPTNQSFPPNIIHYNEPIRRSGRASKSHLVQELVRFGGERVFILNGKEYSETEWLTFEKQERDAGRRTRMPERRVKDAQVYARGRIRHEDHATIVLKTWHRVYMNGEWSVTPLAFYD